MYRSIYGPVPSRRLGISLGIDIIPYKICSFNCVYCECGRNSLLTVERKDFFPIDVVVEEVRDYLSRNPYPDFLTISGSGEPTLHSRLGELIHLLKEDYPEIKVAVITNSSLMHLKDVRSELYESDVVLPSLDAALEKTFRKINRPHRTIELSDIIEGLVYFREEFKAISPSKQIWLEVFIVEGLNADRRNIEAIREACIKIKPDKIQLNTLDRPGTEEWVRPARREVLEMVKTELELENVEIISRFRHRGEIIHYRSDIESAILELVERRPSTTEDIAEMLGISEEEVCKYIDILEREGRILPKIVYGERANNVFYSLNRKR